MIIGATLAILMVLVLLSLILGGDFIGGVVSTGVDNEAIVNGSLTTYVVPAQDVLFSIDTTSLIVAGIAVLVTVGIVAGITGVQVLGSGLNAQSARIIIIITAFSGLWATLSILAFSLINSIEVFGSMIYISLTIGYVIGVLQRISGGGD